MQYTQKPAKLSINIVAWNSMKFLPDLLKTITQQTYKDFTVLVIDNGSTDGADAFLRQEYPEVSLLKNNRNLGFSAAHNQGIRFVIDHCEPEELSNQFILVCNPDILMSPTFLERLMQVVVQHPDVGSFGGKLLRAYGENLTDEVLQETVLSDIIDSTGLNPHKDRTVTDCGAGEKDMGQYDDREEVFGISGACVLYRASALERVRFGDEFFDHDFFAYKEDIDLAWRLQHARWKSLYVPKAIAHHYRGMYGKETSGLFAKLSNRKKKSMQRNYYSTRNHWLVLFKNLRVSSFLLCFPRIVIHEFARVIYICLLEPSSLRAIVDVVRLFPRMLKKRRALFAVATAESRQIRKWFL